VTPASRHIAIASSDLAPGLDAASAFAAAARSRGAELTVTLSIDRGGLDRAARLELMRKWSRRHGPALRILDTTERAQLCALAASRGVPTSVAEFALGIGSHGAWAPGANRNLLRLATSHQRTVIIDDDLRPRLFSPARPGPQGTLALVMDRDPTEHWYFEDAQAADVFQRPDDPLDVLAAGLELESPAALPPVSACALGMAGDPGCGNRLPHLVASPTSLSRLLLDDGSYPARADSRMMMRSVTGATLCNGHGWTPSVVAYEADQLLPPFIPSLRGQGAVWGACIQGGAAWTLARMAGALEHRLHAPRRFDGAHLLEGTIRMTVARLLQMALATSRMPSRAISPTSALSCIAARLRELAASPRVFEEWSCHAQRKRVLALSDLLENALDAHPCAPQAWRDEVVFTRTALHATLDDSSLLDSPSGDAVWVRSYFLRFAELCDVWPQFQVVASCLRNS
jgi:hypothetical protein